MRARSSSIVGNALRTGVVVMWAALSVGCYEDVSPDAPPTAQQQPVAGQNQGPLTATAQGQGGGSALGGAKRSAENIVDQAERKSQETADQADDPGNPNRR